MSFDFNGIVLFCLKSGYNGKFEPRDEPLESIPLWLETLRKADIP